MAEATSAGETTGESPKEKDGSHLVRTLSLFCLLGAAIVLLAVPTGCSGAMGKKCPAYSFNEPWILRGERASVAFVALLLMAALIWYTMVKGQMPTTFGFSALALTFTQKEAAKTTKELADRLASAQLDTKGSVKALTALLEQTRERVENLEHRE